ncbi:MAG: hypothetical protein RI936_1064 [Pseudomonadota bacterium]
MRPALAACGLALACTAAQAEESSFSRFLSAFNETTSVGLVPPAERSSGWGWFGDAWKGFKTTAAEGRNGLLVPMYTWHPTPSYNNRSEQNSYTWGAGISRTMIDDRGNERMVYALAFSDSHYDFQPMVGYGWVARWALGGSGVYGGLGYTAGLTIRSDVGYVVPIPYLVPMASLGTDVFTMYAAYVPGSNVAFVFSRLQLDSTNEISSSAGASPWARRTLVYAGGGWVKTDQEGVDGVTVSSGGAPLFGIRHDIGRGWAVDFSVNRSNHDIAYFRLPLGSVRFTQYNLAGQYHFEATPSLRLHAGLGLSYLDVGDGSLNGAAIENGALAPLIQAGATWAASPALRVVGGLNLATPRVDLTLPRTTTGTAIKPSPSLFYLGVGYAF